jgi:hypothetical protein
VQIVNFPTKDHWRSPSRLADIERGLDHLVAHAMDWSITSLALPPLGCGNGGLEWSEVGPLIYRKLHSMPIDVEVYAPYGTPKQQLTNEFLAAPSQMTLEGKGRKRIRCRRSCPRLAECTGLLHPPWSGHCRRRAGRSDLTQAVATLFRTGACDRLVCLNPDLPSEVQKDAIAN